jgi:hypothetical protein
MENKYERSEEGYKNKKWIIIGIKGIRNYVPLNFNSPFAVVTVKFVMN